MVELWFLVWFLIWLHRNGIMFREDDLEIDSLLDLIKIRSWYWIRAKVDDGVYFSFME